MITPQLPELVVELLSQGHFVNITTNGTITKQFEAFEKLALSRDVDFSHLNFSFSLHYLELKRLGTIDRFWDNVKRVKKMGCSFVVQFNLCDEYEPYLSEIKKECLKNVKALPQVAATRDEVDLKSAVKLYTKHSIGEYTRIGETFNSPLFDFTMKNFMIKRREFCYAGKWSYVLNLSTGILKPCYCSYSYMNIYKDPRTKIRLTPIGRHCRSPFCMNSSHFIAMGVIPEYQAPTYADLRNRRCEDGEEWYTKSFKEMASNKFYDYLSTDISMKERFQIEFRALCDKLLSIIIELSPKTLIRSLKNRV